MRKRKSWLRQALYALMSARTDLCRGVPGDRHPYRDWIQDAKTEIPEKQKEFWVW
jgi:hypothetical protein